MQWWHWEIASRGVTGQAVAQHLAVCRHTVSALRTRYNTTQRVNDKPRSGSHRGTTTSQVLPNRITTATTTVTQIPRLRTMSDQTVGNRLREAGIFTRRPVRRNVFTPCHLAERLQWWQVEDTCQVGRKEMIYLTTHSTHFIYGYMASDIWLRTILIVREETRCRHMG